MFPIFHAMLAAILGTGASAAPAPHVPSGAKRSTLPVVTYGASALGQPAGGVEEVSNKDVKCMKGKRGVAGTDQQQQGHHNARLVPASHASLSSPISACTCRAGITTGGAPLHTTAMTQKQPRPASNASTVGSPIPQHHLLSRGAHQAKGTSDYGTTSAKGKRPVQQDHSVAAPALLQYKAWLVGMQGRQRPRGRYEHLLRGGPLLALGVGALMALCWFRPPRCNACRALRVLPLGASGGPDLCHARSVVSTSPDEASTRGSRESLGLAPVKGKGQSHAGAPIGLAASFTPPFPCPSSKQAPRPVKSCCCRALLVIGCLDLTRGCRGSDRLAAPAATIRSRGPEAAGVVGECGSRGMQ